MVLDYKDVRFSFAQRRFQRRKKIAKLALLALLSLAALLAWRYVLETRRIARVEKLLLAGDTAGADSALQARARYWFQARAGAELRALRHLLAGDLDSARADLEALGRPHRQSAISRVKFLGYFSDHARYRELRVYASYLAELGGDPLQWYRAQALTALGDVAGARRLLQQTG